MSRDYGKLRPAVVVQSDYVTGTDSLVLCPLTTDLQPTPLFRVDLAPSKQNGLRKPSQAMVDKIAGTPLTRIRKRIGRLEDDALDRLNIALGLVIGLAD